MSRTAGSMKIAYNSGDSGLPCATPHCTAKAGGRADPSAHAAGCRRVHSQQNGNGEDLDTALKEAVEQKSVRV